MTLDVAVVGAGAVGSAAALALAERGAATVVLERFVAGHARGSSHGATRIFRLAYPAPDYVRLARSALEAWRRLEESARRDLLVVRGGLYTGSWAEECAAGLSACGVPHEWLLGAEAAERFPTIRFDPDEHILFQPDGGVCLAAETVAAQVELARARGVEVRESEPAIRLRVGDDDVEVETAQGTYRARAVVVAAGAWAGELLAQVGIRLALVPSLVQVSYFEPLAGDTRGLPPLIEAGAGLGMLGTGGYFVPPDGGQDGIKVSFGAPGRTVDPRDGPFRVDPGQERRDAAFAARRLRKLDPSPSRSEACLYTMTPDEDFVLDRVGRVVVASCCSGHGFKFTPALGELVADLALGREPGFPLGRFAASRPGVAR